MKCELAALVNAVSTKSLTDVVLNADTLPQAAEVYCLEPKLILPVTFTIQINLECMHDCCSIPEHNLDRNYLACNLVSM